MNNHELNALQQQKVATMHRLREATEKRDTHAQYASEISRVKRAHPKHAHKESGKYLETASLWAIQELGKLDKHCLEEEHRLAGIEKALRDAEQAAQNASA